MTSLHFLALLFIAGLLFHCSFDFRKHFLPKLLSDKSFQHFTFFLLMGLFFLWSARAGVKEGLDIHFLGMTLTTLIYGWRVAFTLMLPVCLCLFATGQVELTGLPAMILLSSLIPICFSYWIFRLSYLYLTRNIFVYIFVAGFFNGGVAGILHLLANSLYQYWLGYHDWEVIQNNYTVFALLIAFPEGLLNGMGAAIMAVYRPQWLRTFSDKRYIYDHYRK